MDFFRKDVGEVISELNSNEEMGLSTTEAQARILVMGKMFLPQKRRKAFLQRYLTT